MHCKTTVGRLSYLATGTIKNQVTYRCDVTDQKVIPDRDSGHIQAMTKASSTLSTISGVFLLLSAQVHGKLSKNLSL